MGDRFTLSLGGLTVSWEVSPDETGHLWLHGDLDNLTVPVLRQVFDTLSEHRCHVLRLDLAGLVFIDSSGLGALVNSWRHCRHHDGEMTVSNPTVAVRRLMDMTGISSFLLAPA